MLAVLRELAAGLRDQASAEAAELLELKRRDVAREQRQRGRVESSREGLDDVRHNNSK